MSRSNINSRRKNVLLIQPSKAIRLLLVVLFFAFYGVVNAQCSITSTTNASALSCGTSLLSSCGGILYIGNGSTSMSLVMNDDLDLICLGPIRFIVKNNATLDFSGSNKDLKLAAGSSIEFETGSTIYSGSGCSASDRIYVGGTAVSNCIGNGSKPSFTTLVTNGGFSSINASASPSSICNSGSSTITATATPSSGATYKWYSVASGGTAIYTGNSYSTGTISTTTTYYVEASYGSPAYTTVRKAVTVTVSASPGAPGVITGAATQCAGATSQVYSVAPVANATSYNWYVPAGWVITSGSGTNSITVTVGGSSSSGNVNVNAINSCGTGYGPYQYVTVNPIPSAPGAASPYSPTCTGFTAQWAYTSYATKYYLDVATNSGFTSFVSGYNNLDVGNNLNAVLSGLTPGTTYYYRVRAYSPCGTSPSSTTRTYATSPVPTVAPVANAASSSDCSSVTVNWSLAANATGYYLDIATDNAFTTFVTGYNSYNIAYSATSFYAGGLPSGTLYYRLRGYNSCGVTANSNTISFSTTSPIGGTISPVQAICSGTSPANLTLTGYTTTNTAILKWQKSSNASFSSPTDIAGTTATLSGTTIGNLSANTYFRAVVQNQFGSWCTANSNPVLITVASVTTTPSVTLIQPTCAISTGTITVNTPAPAAGITYTVVGKSPVVAAITNATGVFSGLTSGTYDVTANNTSACSVSAATSVTINELVTNTWTTVWSNGTPSNTQKLVFSGNYPPAIDPNVDINGCSCKVTGSTIVTIKSGRTLTITNEVTVVGGGSLIFENNASLVQINDEAINSGVITYKRKTASVLNSDYTYWSSPVANQQLANVSSSYASGMFYSYDDFAIPEDWKQETNTTVMQIGKGYIIRGPQTVSPPAFYDASFVGVPNNGTKNISIGSAGTSNLIGNPYPSAINADLFLAANSSLVEGTIYFWTHKTAIQLAENIVNGTAGSGTYAYTSDDYASYNTTGGVGTGNSINGVEQIANKPTGKIAAAQSFFTTSKASGTVTFNNSMRVSGNNTQFFKIKNPKEKTSNTIEKNRVWLNLTNTQGAFKQTLVGYITNATNDFDDRFDGESYDANEFVDFYSVNQDKNLVIQGRALPFDENDEVPLGFRTTIDGAFTIAIDQVDGLLTNQAVFIEDKLTNTVFDLKSGNYTFNTTSGTFNDRFVLKYSNKTLGTNTFDSFQKTVLVSNKNKQIKINSFAETIDKVLIYDVLGRQIYQKDKVNSNELAIANLVSSNQTLLVKTILQNGKTVTNKIMY